jgi:hypothetical protein
MSIQNTKQTAAEFFRKYSDIIKEAEQITESIASHINGLLDKGHTVKSQATGRRGPRYSN